MTVSRELLMRYHDGEVSESEARDVEASIEQDPALAEEAEAYAELGSFIRAWGKVSSPRQFDIADSVMTALEQRPAPLVHLRPHARVHSLVPRIATWLSLGAAIAAGSVLVVRSWSAPRPKPGAVRAAATHLVVASTAAPEMSAVLEEQEPKPAPATIESVDFGTNTGTVFVVSTDSSETPVVWMPDDTDPDEDNEDRSKSL